MQNKLLTIAFALSLASSLQLMAQYLPENASYWKYGTEDGAIHYVVEIGTTRNHDKTFVVLHGGYGKEHSDFINMVLPFSNEFRFVLYDQRGSLRSPAPDSTLTLQVFAEDLERLRKELNLNKLQIIGHSMGALIAFDYLSSYPENVKSLALIGAPPNFYHRSVYGDLSDLSQKYEVLKNDLDSLIQVNQESKLKELHLENQEKLSARQHYQQAHIEYAAGNLYDIDKWNKIGFAFYNPRVIEMIRKNTEYDEWDQRRERLSKTVTSLDVPIRVINGKYDYIGGFEIYWPVLMEKMQDARFYSIDKAIHMPWIDQPDTFNEVFGSILKESSLY